MGTQGEFFEKPEPRVPEIVDEPTATAIEEPVAAVATSDGSVDDARVAPPTAQPKLAIKRGLKDLSIPKLYYSISEVSRLTGLEPYVLRYWETEFDELNPQKNRAGNRIYSNKDIKFILRIKELLREQRYTIEGAKHILKEERQAEKERPQQLEATGPDPDQIILPTEPKQAPKLSISLAELQEMKTALVGLRAMLQQAR
jgi:DNA-binding transcriptional MerR regulator